MLIMPVSAWAECKLMEYTEVQDMTEKELKENIARYKKSIADTDKEIAKLQKEKTPDSLNLSNMKAEDQNCKYQQIGQFENALNRRIYKKSN